MKVVSLIKTSQSNRHVNDDSDKNETNQKDRSQEHKGLPGPFLEPTEESVFTIANLPLRPVFLLSHAITIFVSIIVVLAGAKSLLANLVCFAFVVRDAGPRYAHVVNVALVIDIAFTCLGAL